MSAPKVVKEPKSVVPALIPPIEVLDNRIILSGIAKYYKPKDLINKQVMVIVNLEPRKMMGIQSEGMLLLAEDPDGSLKLMQPEDKITNGSIVC